MNKQWGIAVAAIAEAAEGTVKAQQVVIDMYKAEADRYAALATQQHTAVVAAQATVAAVDSANPPDTSSAPNLAARDHVIEAQAAEITDLHGVISAQARAIILLQGSKDVLSGALASRPALYPRFVGPNVGLGVFGGVCGLRPDGKPAPCVGIGITINLFSVRL